jgi:hypothetical protein
MWFTPAQSATRQESRGRQSVMSKQILHPLDFDGEGFIVSRSGRGAAGTYVS